ncbi:MAG: hypothetical protein IJ358_04245 [Clostridia bacterium]|nr:hypothetical protein [Clostridia bacterium]
MEKKAVKKPVKSTAKAEKVVGAKTTTKKVAPKTVKQDVAKVEKVEVVQPKVETKPVEKVEKKGITLNQDLNLMIGLFSLITIISFCFAFQGGDAEILGWELVLKSGAYSRAFQVLMVAYVVAIVIDCILSIRLDTENEIVNIVEKVLYMFTFIINFIVCAVLLSLIAKVGIGLIIFLIISIISAIVKLARIYAQK